jgi:hypothetical protein
MFFTMMIVILAAVQAFALPGVYKAGAASITMATGMCKTSTISLDGTGFGTSPLVSGGFLIQNTNEDAVDITDCQVYDGTLTPAIWWYPGSIVFDPTGFPGGLFVATANLDPGVTPSSDILLCDVTFCGVGAGDAYLSIDTVPDYDTWVAKDFTVYDSTIDAAVISVRVCDCPCECGMASGPFEVQANVSGDPVTAIYTAGEIPTFCDNPPNFVYADNCIHGSIDPNTGVFTVPAFTSPPEENCTISVTDTANIDPNNGNPTICEPRYITILAGTCECEGNFNEDQDVDGFDAATFKTDFGRGGFVRPCINGDLCNGDFSCDGDVDGSDASLFKSDFGRGQFNNPCPGCPRDPWCEY